MTKSIKALAITITLVIIILANSFGVKAQNPVNTEMNFTSVPTLLSGTPLSVGAKYKFIDVYPGTRAEITIVSATGGATVVILDDNNLTKPEAFSPKISVPANSNGLVEFKIEFFVGNGNSGSRRNIDTVRVTAMDIDGNAELHEVDALNLGAGSVVSYFTNTLEIAVTQSGNEYKATNIGGNEYTEVDTAAKQVMFTLMNTNINQFTYKAGANNLATSPVNRQKGTYYKGFNYLSTLPVKYVAFTALATEKSVLLNWITEQELNNSHFDVERSFDGKTFTNIGIVLDGFENGNKMNYAFKDNATSLQENSIVYYRLKQVDINGAFTYSNILAVRFKNSNDVTMQVSPNPFVESVTARFNSSEKGVAAMHIINLSGQTVVNKNIAVNKGFNNLQISGLSILPGGTYMATLVMNGKMIATQKIVK